GSVADVCETWTSGAVYVGGGICFSYRSAQLNFTQAANVCQSESSGHLAELRTNYQMDTAGALVMGRVSKSVWIGATDLVQESVYQWFSNGDKADIPASWWAWGEPTDQSTITIDEDCIAMNFYGKLQDQSCGLFGALICQKDVGNLCDGVFPGAEYYNGSCYMPVLDTLTIDGAQERCESLNAYVAEPNTAGEMAFLKMLASMSFSSSTSVMLGLIKTSGSNGTAYLEMSTGHQATDFKTLGAIMISTDLFKQAEREVVVMSGPLSWELTTMLDSESAHSICEKGLSVIPVYSHAYLATLPDSALSVTDHALLSAGHAHLQPGWITVELTSDPAGAKEEFTFLSQEGLHHPMIIGAENRRFLLRSTEPLHVTLTLWNSDLTAISSSLLLPVGTSGVAESRLVYPSPRGVSLGMIVQGESVAQLTVALSGGDATSAARLGQFHYHVWPWWIFSVGLSERLQTLHVDSVSGYSRAALVHASLPLTTVASEGQTTGTGDVTFEQILSTSQVGTEYVTFPSMLPDPGATFTLVAVHNDTVVQVSQTAVSLLKAGDTSHLDLATGEFHHMIGSKPFYVYARLGGT
ncbi:hypothetical protein EGW08_008991, partial [Elysia chlorotica]